MKKITFFLFLSLFLSSCELNSDKNDYVQNLENRILDLERKNKNLEKQNLDLEHKIAIIGSNLSDLELRFGFHQKYNH
tara:strand:- start:701 stop:934 length:234 start_codon:yes stop_codon:yes gene_type:complete